MLPEPSLIPSLAPRSGLLTRLLMQFLASTLLTIFYTPGGVAGWVLDLLFRSYPSVARVLSPRLIPVPVRTGRAFGLRRSVQ
jgi:hypothetical protein